MKGYDEGPFQNFAAVSFGGGADTPEQFIHGEDLYARIECSDAGTQFDLETKITRFPEEGLITRACACPGLVASGLHDVYELRITVPLTASWPDCVIGASSGAVLDVLFPPEPDGWGTGSPASAGNATETWGRCDTSGGWSGGLIGGGYLLTIRFHLNCRADCC